jgi:hypothetical protein
MQENALIVASLLTRSRDPSLLLRHPSVYSCCLATNEARRCDAMRDSFTALFGSARLGTGRQGTRKHRFVYCCVIVGARLMLQFLHGVNIPQYVPPIIPVTQTKIMDWICCVFLSYESTRSPLRRQSMNDFTISKQT